MTSIYYNRDIYVLILRFRWSTMALGLLMGVVWGTTAGGYMRLEGTLPRMATRHSGYKVEIPRGKRTVPRGYAIDVKSL